MFALVKNDDSIKLFAPYTVWEDKNGTQYSADNLLSLTAEQKQDLGIYDVAYATRPDDRFYNVSENQPQFDSVEKIVKVEFTAVAKPLDDAEASVGTDPAGAEYPIPAVFGIKPTWIAQVKSISNSLLSSSDWMLVRKIERNVDVPAATATFRAAVIAEATRLETAISAATTVEELITAVESASWPTAE